MILDYWFLTGVSSLVVFFVGMFLMLGKKEFFADFEGPITTGDVATFSVWIVGAVLLGPVSAVVALIFIVGMAMKSERVLWKPKT